MKLFGEYEAIKFPEENLIFITRNESLYYIYNPQWNSWRKHRNAGYDHLTVSNYPDVSREELMEAVGGFFPQKETDFTRLCNPSQLSIRETLNLLENDYADYMSNRTIYGIVHWLLLRSDIPHQSFNKIGKLFDYAMKRKENDNDVITQIKELSFVIIGRDIFKREIEIIDGHNGSSYFWIMPVRVIDESDTNDTDNVAEMSSAEISIEEDDVAVYLKPFLYKHFDDELKANRQRADCFAEDNSVHGFEWYLTHNFYTHESMAAVLADIRDTVDALSSGRKNEFTEDLCRETVRNVYWQMYFRFPDEDELVKFQKNNSPEYQAEIDVLLDFYRRFLYRIEYMLKVGREKGYDLISVMGP